MLVVGRDLNPGRSGKKRVRLLMVYEEGWPDHPPMLLKPPDEPPERRLHAGGPAADPCHATSQDPPAGGRLTPMTGPLPGHDGAWSLSCGEALPLPVTDGPRLLRVLEGRLWLTTDGVRQRPSDDVWLLPGESFHLQPGLAWLVEARSEGRFQVLTMKSPARRHDWMQRLVGCIVPRRARTLK